MNKEVVVYSSTTCHYCKVAKEYLNEKGIEFIEKNVSTDMDARKELMKMGFMGVPVIQIGEETIEGFNKAELDRILG